MHQKCLILANTGTTHIDRRLHCIAFDSVCHRYPFPILSLTHNSLYVFPLSYSRGKDSTNTYTVQNRRIKSDSLSAKCYVCVFTSNMVQIILFNNNKVLFSLCVFHPNIGALNSSKSTKQKNFRLGFSRGNKIKMKNANQIQQTIRVIKRKDF